MNSNLYEATSLSHIEFTAWARDQVYTFLIGGINGIFDKYEVVANGISRFKGSNDVLLLQDVVEFESYSLNVGETDHIANILFWFRSLTGIPEGSNSLVPSVTIFLENFKEIGLFNFQMVFAEILGDPVAKMLRTLSF